MATRQDNPDSDEFEKLSLSDSNYAKVIFNDVKDFYFTKRDIYLMCAMMPPDLPMKGDRVAIFKVGWSSPDDFLQAEPCQDNLFSTDIDVTFPGSSLPKEDGEYYQFCYLNVAGQVMGASTPFVFKTCPAEDLFIEEDIENDLMLIQTRTSKLEQDLQNAIVDRNAIQIEKEKLEERCRLQNERLMRYQKVTKDQEEELMELKAKLKTESKTCTANKEEIGIKRKEILELRFSINKMQAAASAFEEEKAEMNKTITNLTLERDGYKATCSTLRGKVSKLFDLEKSSQLTIAKYLEAISFYEKKCTELDREAQDKNQAIKHLNLTLREVQLQRSEYNLQLADKELMLIAMADSKSLAAEELRNYSEKQAEIEAEMRGLKEELEKCKAQVEILSNEKTEVCLQLKVSLSENAVIKNENKLLLEKQTGLQEQSIKLNLEVSDLQNRLALGANEYRRKYIEWHTLQQKVLKLEENLSSLQSNKQEDIWVPSLSQSATATNGQECLSGAQDLNLPLRNSQSSLSESQVPLSDTKNVSVGSNLNLEQSAKIHAAMENQLQKFHGANSFSSSLTEINVAENEETSDAQLTTSSISQSSYPYPPYYPYPYPKNATTDDSPYNCGNVSNSSTVSSGPSAERPILNSGADEDSFIVIPPSNNQVKVQVHPYFQRSSFFNFRRDVRIPQEEDENSSRQITCPICQKRFPENSDINEHIDNHIYLKCPVCFDLFHREEFGMQSFNKHVIDHLD